MQFLPIACRCTPAWLLAAFACGCSSNHAPDVPLPTPVDLATVYTSYFNPEPLNHAQHEEINTVIAAANREAGVPWFVYVCYSRDGRYRVNAYFKPMSQNGRVQHGHIVFIDNGIAFDKQRQVATQLNAKWPPSQPYVHIAAEERGRSAVPAESDLPFSLPDNLNDEELIKVAHAARAAVITKDPAAASMPIRTIDVAEDEIIHVFFGWQAHELNGYGKSVTLRRDGTSYVTTSIGFWTS